jgi:methyl-accepting chemotaxis protein
MTTLAPAPAPTRTPLQVTEPDLVPLGTFPKSPRTGSRVLALFRNLPTARKLMAGFLAVAALMVAVGGVGLYQLGAADQRLTELDENVLSAVQDLSVVQSGLEEMRFQITDLAISPVSANDAIEAKLAELDTTVDDAWAEYRSTEVSGGEEAATAFETALAGYRGVRDEQAVPLARAKRLTQFLAVLDDQVTPLFETMHKQLEELVVLEEKVGAEQVVTASAAYSTARNLIVALVVISLALSIFLAVFIGRLVAQPLRRTVTVLQGLADGRLDARLDVNSRDEVGQMAAALNAALENLSVAFTKLGDNAHTLASASEELSATAGQMSGSASESASQAGLVSAAAEQVSRNVQTVATGTEEMSASIREIAQNATNAASVAAQAVGVAQSTNATVAKLGESSAEVGNVIKVINSIAEQTNLLALNATIEAARAGEAGKGFAVVANEVKELAQETSKATEDISRRIEAIQSDTDAAVSAIAEIAEIIGQINDTQTTIASAVEEQTATTNEMSRNVTEAATGSADIAQNITGVARTANDTQAAAGSTSEAAEELARMAADMQGLVGQFRY